MTEFAFFDCKNQVLDFLEYFNEFHRSPRNKLVTYEQFPRTHVLDRFYLLLAEYGRGESVEGIRESMRKIKQELDDHSEMLASGDVWDELEPFRVSIRALAKILAKHIQDVAELAVLVIDCERLKIPPLQQKFLICIRDARAFSKERALSRDYVRSQVPTKSENSLDTHWSNLRVKLNREFGSTFTPKAGGQKGHFFTDVAFILTGLHLDA